MTNEELVSRLQSTDPETGEAADILGELWEQNASLVRQTVHRLTGLDYGNSDFPDMEQQAFFGFRAAAFTYDPVAGAAKFSTYAVKRIEWELSRYYEQNGYTMRVPSYMRQRMRECVKRQQERERIDGHSVPLESILDEMGLSVQEVRTTLSAIHTLEFKSLEAPVPGTDGLTLADTLATDSNLDNVDGEQEWHRELHKLLSKALRKIPTTSRGVVVRHYFAGVSLSEQAREMGLTLEALRQREKRALKKIRYGKYGVALTEFARTEHERQNWAMRIGRKRENLEMLNLSDQERRFLL